MTATAKVDQANGSTALATAQATSMLDVISRASRDPSVDVDKLERLLAIQERMMADARRVEFCAALARIQAVLPQIGKSGTIDRGQGRGTSKYAKLEDIDDVVRPLCSAEGFSVSLDSRPVALGVEYACTLSHRAGHEVTRTLVLPVDNGAGRSAVQSMGSTTSYARRYLLSMQLNIITCNEDDDGSMGEAHRERRQSPPSQERGSAAPHEGPVAETPSREAAPQSRASGDGPARATGDAASAALFAQRQVELEACSGHRTTAGLRKVGVAIASDGGRGLLTLDQAADLRALAAEVKLRIKANELASEKAEADKPDAGKGDDDFPPDPIERARTVQAGPPCVVCGKPTGADAVRTSGAAGVAWRHAGCSPFGAPAHDEADSPPPDDYVSPDEGP